MKQILIALLSLFTCFCAVSRTLTPEEALERAQRSQQSNKRFAPAKYTNPKLVFTQTVPTADIPAVYIFNNEEGQGFMVISADDAVMPLLGFSDNGFIDPGNMPDNFRWWIEEYARQIEWAAQHPALAPATESSRATDFDPIEPLCQTKWNQDYPYNISAPYVNGAQCVTGCVATAMAQVMKYHNWPSKGFGEHSYDWNGTTLSKDFGNVAFEWEKMYSSHTQYTTNAAVARLMNACGISVDMYYGVNESISSNSLVPDALYNYFRYDCCHELCKNDYTNKEWQQMLWDNLKNYGPLVYGGCKATSGHAFVCDGYSSNGYFHFNWGWGGMDDGYFTTNTLNGYNTGQSAIFGIRPDEGGCRISDFEQMSTIRTGEPFDIQINVYNPHDYPIDAELLPIFYSEDFKEITGYGTTVSVHLEKEQKPTIVNGSFDFVETPPAGLCVFSIGTMENGKIVNRYTGNGKYTIIEEGQDCVAKILKITYGDAFGEIKIDYEFKARKGRFDGALRLVFTDEKNMFWQISMNNISCEQGHTIQSSFVYKLSNPIGGRTYAFNLNINGGEPLMDSSYHFTLASEPDLREAPESVDLGLSVNWSSRNYGTKEAAEYGSHYGWGAPASQSLNHNTYPVMDDIGNTQYDIMAQEWGHGYRMPTVDEVAELKDKCRWELITVNDVRVYKVTGPNGNFIYIPASGVMNYPKISDQGVKAFIWCSNQLGTNTGWALHINSATNRTISSTYKYNGLSLRGVTNQTVNDSNSDVDDIIIGGSKNVTIYNLNGVKVFEGDEADAQLAPGFYIFVKNGKSTKRMIR